MIISNATQAQQHYTSVYREVSRRSEIEGASPHKLVELLIEGAIKRIDNARISIENSDIEVRGVEINKALDIIAELRSSLNMENGGEISANLHSIYLFIESNLIEAHKDANKELLIAPADLLIDLLETWRKIK